MRIILIKDVPNLGDIGQTKDVNPGYARNYLIPKGLAVLPNDPKAKEIAQEKITREKESRKEKTKAEIKVAELDGQTFIFQAKADKKGNLYGSIGPKEIAAKTGIDVNLIKDHLKKLGTYPLEIKISPDDIATVKIVIDKEK